MKISLKNLKSSFRCLGIVIKRHPWFLVGQIISMICLIVQTLIPINVVGQIVGIFQDKIGFENIVFNQEVFNEILYVILKNMAIYITLNIVHQLIDFLMYFISSHFRMSYATTLFKKLSSIDYSFYQNSNFLDNYMRALDGGAEMIYEVANNQMILIEEIIQIIFIFSLILTVNYLAIIYTVVIAILYMIARKKSGLIQFDKNTADRQFNRLEWGISRVYFVKDAIPDIKTTSISDVMIDVHMEAGKNKIANHKKYIAKKTILDIIGAILINSIYPIIILIVCIAAINTNDLASLSAVTVAATTIAQAVHYITGILTTIQISSLEAKVTFDILDIDPNIEKNVGIVFEDEFQKLDIENIEFGYDENINILNDISIHINKGEKIAIVGTNGAGKTTLVKLLLRLYDVKNGSIKLNGSNYKEFNAKSIRRKIGAVFQNPEVYSLTIAENVLLKRIETDEERQLVIDALKFADIYDYIMTLPEGIDTVVTREFNKQGAIFSGGQMQKIAVARGFAQNYEVLLLDEPSSKLDPLAETKMYHNMLNMGKGKTLIFISHRLSATVNCDRIYLFEKGKIIEQGTHEEMLNIENGKYREMFISQAEKYIGDNYD